MDKMNNTNKINAEELSAKTDDQIREMINIINEDMLTNIGNITYLQIIRRSIKLRDKFYSTEYIIKHHNEEGKCIEALYSKANKEVISLINAPESISRFVNDINDNKALRKEIVKHLRSLSSYITELSYANEISSELLYKSSIKDNKEQASEIDLQAFYNSIYGFLMEDTQYLKEKVMDLVSIMPMRISKVKYYDILKKALIKSLEDKNKSLVDDTISRFKDIFIGTLSAQYGQKYNAYFRMSQEFKSINYKEVTDHKLQEIKSKSKKVIEEIDKLSIILTNLGIIINAFIVLGLVVDITELIIDDFTIIRDKYLKWLDGKLLEDDLVSIIDNNIRKLEDSFFDINIAFEKIYNESSNRKELVDEKTKNKLKEIQKILLYTNDAFLEKENLVLNEEAERLEGYIEQSVNNFIQFIDRSIKEMNNLQRKARMRRILSLTDLPFDSPDDFYQYMRNSLEVNSNWEDVVAALDYCTMIISKYRKK